LVAAKRSLSKTWSTQCAAAWRVDRWLPIRDAARLGCAWNGVLHICAAACYGHRPARTDEQQERRSVCMHHSRSWATSSRRWWPWPLPTPHTSRSPTGQASAS